MDYVICYIDLWTEHRVPLTLKLGSKEMRIITKLKYVVLVLLTVAACISLGQGLNNAILRQDGSKDNKWDSSRALLEHTDPYRAFLDSNGKSPFTLSQAPSYPASGLVFLWPFAVWEWSVAKILWAISNLLFTAIILFCLFWLLPIDTSRITKLLIATLFVAGTPWRNVVGNGQYALFTLAFFLLAIVMFQRSAKGAGIPLAVSWFKYTIAFPLSLFFTRSKRGWATILVATAIHAALTIFIAIWVDTSPVNLLLGTIQVAQYSTDRGYLDVFAIASQLGLSSKLVPAVFALVILGVTYSAVRRDDDDLSCLSILSMAAMTVVYHRIYDFMVLVIPLSYALRERAMNTRAKCYLLVIGMIWFVDKIVYVVSNQAWFSPFVGCLSLYFWLKVLMFYGVLCADWFIAFKFRK